MSYIQNHGYASNPYIQFVDEDGKPLSAGTLTTYIAGTTTPVTTYKDWNQTLNPSTITLDINGGCTIILNQALRYKFEIRESDGSLFKTFDNIEAYNSGGNQIINQQVVVEVEEGTGIDVVASTQDELTKYTISIDDSIVVTHTKLESDLQQLITDTKKFVNESIEKANEIQDIHTKEYIDGEIDKLESSVNSSLAGKKNLQEPVDKSGSVTKTITRIQQDAQGKIDVTYSDIALPNNVTIESSDNSINITDDGKGNFDLTLNGGEVDNTWAHFKNDGIWYNINNTTYTDVSSGLTLAEGELIPSISSTLPAGLYFFSIELAYNSHTVEDAYQKIDLKIMYGNTELRAESFNFDKAKPDGVFQTEWSSGLFKLKNSGTIAIKLALGSSGFVTNNKNDVKVSHFFIRKIDQLTFGGGGGGGSGDNDKVAVDENATPGYLSDVLISDTDLVSLIKSGNTLRINVNTEYSSDPKLQTMDESQIDSATNNYGNYALQSGYSELLWGDTNNTSYQWLNASVYQMMRLSDAQGTITKANLALCGSLSFSNPPPCFNVGIFSKEGTLLGQSGLKFYGTDFNSDEELCSVDMTESYEGSLIIDRNAHYIVMLWSCGLQIAGLDKSNNYNYVYDTTLRQNLEGNISSPTWPGISALTNRASVIPYISFGAQQLT